MESTVSQIRCRSTSSRPEATSLTRRFAYNSSFTISMFFLCKSADALRKASDGRIGPGIHSGLSPQSRNLRSRSSRDTQMSSGTVYQHRRPSAGTSAFLTPTILLSPSIIELIPLPPPASWGSRYCFGREKASLEMERRGSCRPQGAFGAPRTRACRP